MGFFMLLNLSLSLWVSDVESQGFKKVDPDRWEFANEWFLRGQTHLLKNVVRKKHSRNSCSLQSRHGEEEDEEGIVMEIVRLKQEQKDLEQELELMNKRLETTEKRPQQMMDFLYKVVEDPEVLPRLLMEKQRTNRLVSSEKKRRLMISSSTSPPSSSGVAATTSSAMSEEGEEESTTLGVISSISSPSPETPAAVSAASLSQRQVMGRPLMAENAYNCVANPSYQLSSASTAVVGSVKTVAPPMNGISGYDKSSGDLGCFGGTAGGVEGPTLPYPFSLLGGGF